MSVVTSPVAGHVTVHQYPLRGERGVTVIERATAGDPARQIAYVRALPPAARTEGRRYAVSAGRRLVGPSVRYFPGRAAALAAALAMVEAAA